MSDRRKRMESAWWGDDFGEWFDDFALDPFRLAPADAIPNLRAARTSLLKALEAVLKRWIERSENPPHQSPAAKKSKSSSKKGPKKSSKSSSRAHARRGGQRVKVS
jgi:hypothetical protein